jgi:PadR family transcriptional regulator, regulatory protein AphA
MSTSLRLTETSYVVLGILATWGAATSYDLKRRVASSVGYFWSFPHSQLYAEPTRLVAGGLLDEQREEGGRRRRVFSVTPEGRRALAAWLAEPGDEQPELRDPGLLRLFFAEHADAQDVRALVQARLALHQARLHGYRALEDRLPDDGGYPRLTVRRGIYAEDAAIRFWSELAQDPGAGPAV